MKVKNLCDKELKNEKLMLFRHLSFSLTPIYYIYSILMSETPSQTINCNLPNPCYNSHSVVAIE